MAVVTVAPSSGVQAPIGSAVEIRGVSKWFPSPHGGAVQWALQHVSLTLAPGEFVCLLGHSGCGKTTLLNLVAGYLRPDAGEIVVNGRPVQGPAASRGVVFQDHALFPWLTVEQNIAFGLQMRGVPQVEARGAVEEMLRLVGLEGRAKAYPSQLSGGMKQRVGIARALVNRPDVLLMDEPFGALDTLTRTMLQRELLRIWNLLRPTIIFVTHNPAEAAFLADRVAVLTTERHGIAQILPVDLPRPRHHHQSGFGQLIEAIEAPLLGEAKEVGI